MDVGRKKYCCKYPGCNNWYYVTISGSYINKHFFRFPKSQQYNQVWKNACNVDSSVNVTNWRICEEHFDRQHFVNELKQRLNSNAIPISLGVEISDGVVPISEQSEEGKDLSNLENSVPSLCSCFDQPSNSTKICSCLVIPDLAPSQNSKVTGNVWDQDHNYCTRSDNQVLGGNCNKYSFLEESGNGILHKIRPSKKNFTPKKSL